ncbi:MAG: hypothetical protein AVDCRST_MAG26-3109, partial [uncultured Chloroflexia bacterium]
AVCGHGRSPGSHARDRAHAVGVFAELLATDRGHGCTTAVAGRRTCV